MTAVVSGGGGEQPGSVVIVGQSEKCMRSLSACGLTYESFELGPELAAFCKQEFDAAVPLVAFVSFESQTEGPRSVSCVRESHPAARVIAFASSWEDGRKLGAVESGVDICVNCNDGAVALLSVVIRELSEAASLLAVMLKARTTRRLWLSLSATEYIALRAAFVDVTNLAVALQCDISVRTVDRHRNSAFRKLGGGTLMDVVTRMWEAGLHTLPAEHSDLLMNVGKLEAVHRR